ncbi:MAG TPA: hypothetical protein VI358_12440 [Pseudolabrys sp.]
MDYIAKFDALPEADRALMIKIMKTWTAKGEDPTTIAGHVKRWLGNGVVAKNTDEGSGDEGSKFPEDQRDPAAELEMLVDADMDANKVKRSRAYERVLRARPDLNRALARQRDDTLRKGAALYA